MPLGAYARHPGPSSRRKPGCSMYGYRTAFTAVRRYGAATASRLGCASEGAQGHGDHSQSRVTGCIRSCLSNLVEDAVDVTHAGRVLLNPLSQSLLCTVHGGEVTLRAFSHG